MKSVNKFLICLAALLTLASVVNVETAEAQGPPCCYGWGNFTIYGPYEGQRYTQGDVIHFDFYWNYDTDGWACGTGQTKIALWYSSDWGSSWNLISDKIDWYATSYDWTTDKSLPPGYSYIVRVEEKPDQNNCYYCALNCESYTSTFEIVKGCFSPTITSFTPGRQVCVGSNFTMTVNSDASNPTYQWRKDGVTMATTTSNSYTFAPFKASDVASWDVLITDECGAKGSSATSYFSAIYPPAITVQPMSRTICQGNDDTLKIRATGEAKQFQWRRNGVNITGARDSNYVISNATTAINGTYDCVVTGTCSPSVTSSAVTVNVLVAPTLASNITDKTVCLGDPVSLTFTTNNAGLVYSWYKNGVLIPDATSNTLTIANFQDSDIGTYQGVATTPGPNPNNCNVSVRTKEARLSRINTPRITGQPKSTDGCMGGTAELTVVAEGFDVKYQWYKNGVAVSGATTNTLQLNNLTAAQSGAYTVQVMGACNFNQMSTPAQLSVIKRPTIVTGPKDANLAIGDVLTLTIDATDLRSVRWMKNNVTIPGATSAAYTVASVSVKDAGVYNAVVTNGCGSVTTGYAVVKVTDPATLLPELTISQQAVDAGDVPVEYTRTVALTNFITNTGKAPLTVESISVMSPSGTGTFTISQGATTPFTLAPGQTHSIGITFSAPQVGASAAELVIVSNTPGGDVHATLSGKGVLRYTTPESLEFGKVIISNSGQNCANIINNSGMTITLDQAQIGGADAAMFTLQSNMPVILNQGEATQLCVKFAPTSLGAKSAVMTIVSSDGGNTSFDLHGQGDDPTGVITVAGTDELNAYPNPSSGNVSFAGTLVGNGAVLTVVNSIGATVASLTCSTESGTVQWVDPNVPSGTYIVIARKGDTVKTLPLSIIR